MNARLSFSPRYCRAVAENAIQPLVFIYYEAMSICLGSRNVQNLVFFFQKHPVSDPPSRIEVPPLGEHVNEDLDSLSTWLTAKKLPLSVAKIHS